MDLPKDGDFPIVDLSFALGFMKELIKYWGSNTN